MIEIFVVNCATPISERLWKEGYSLCSDEQKAKIDRLHNEAAKCQCLIAGLLQEWYLYRQSACLGERLILSCQPKGKPYIEGKTGLHFNISHSGEWVVLGSAKQELGIDIQRICAWRESVVKRCCTKEEQEQLAVASQRDELFYRYWTQKESYIKYTGEGLSAELSKLLCRKNEIQDLRTGAVCHTACVRWKEAYWMSICTKEETAYCIVEVELQELLQRGALAEKNIG